MVERLRPEASLWEMVKHPFATLNKIAGLNRIPDRRVSKTQKNPYGGQRDPSDPIRREARTQSIYKALGIYSLEETRIELYENFKEMDSDPMIAAILDAFADDAAQSDSERNRVVWCESENEDIQKIVTETLDRLQIDRWAFPIMRALARDGDVFMHIAASRGHGVLAVRPYDPWICSRIEDDIGRLIGFAPADEQGEPTHKENSSIPHYQALHFRLPGREMTDVYGATSSFLWGSRIVWRQLQLMEDQVVLQRLLRRPDRLMVMFDTTGMSHDEAWMTIKDYERRLHREWYQNSDQGSFQSQGVPLDIAKDVVLPRGANNQTDIRNFPATQGNDLLRDLDMFLARLAAGMGFPLGFTGRGNTNDYVPGQSLSRQSAPFAKRSGRLQQSFLPEITRLCMIDLAYRGLDPYRPANTFALNMTTVSPIQEIERNELISMKTDRLERAISFGQNAQLNLDVWIPLALQRYGGFSKQVVQRIYTPQNSEQSTQSFAEARQALKELDESFAKEVQGTLQNILPLANNTVTCKSEFAMSLSEVNEESREELKPAHDLDIKKLNEDVCKAATSTALKPGTPVSTEWATLLTETHKEKRRDSMKTRIKLVSALIGGLDV